ncbi:immunity repressor [Rhodococcus phage Gollum]|nr:immunity repressor [Rhodococcus phage Gollum]
MKNKGLTQSEIAKQYGVTRQYVSWIIKTYGGTKTPRQKMLEHFPWEVPVEMNPQSPYRNMRNHAEYMATGGVGMDKGAGVRSEHPRHTRFRQARWVCAAPKGRGRRGSDDPSE